MPLGNNQFEYACNRYHATKRDQLKVLIFIFNTKKGKYRMRTDILQLQLLMTHGNYAIGDTLTILFFVKIIFRHYFTSTKPVLE
jgi:hypothetical protein